MDFHAEILRRWQTGTDSYLASGRTAVGVQAARILKTDTTRRDKPIECVLMLSGISLHPSEFGQFVSVGLADVKNVNAFESVNLRDIVTVIILFNSLFLVKR